MTHILVTNDDGVMAPGLLALAQAFRELGEVSILAPEQNWSACGHTKTMHRPLRVKEVLLEDGTPALASDGTPSDCVAMAVLGLVADLDLVVSGINPNANLGSDLSYSGTVAAALEASIWSIPGLAVSLDSPPRSKDDLDYSTAADLARQVGRWMLEKDYPGPGVLNLNVPYTPGDPVKGIQVTRQGDRVYYPQLITRQDNRDQPYYWLGGNPPGGKNRPGSDYSSVKDGWASLTPLKLDLTDEDGLAPLRVFIKGREEELPHG